MREDPILFLAGKRINLRCIPQRKIGMAEAVEAMSFSFMVPVIKIIVMEETSSHKTFSIYGKILFLGVGITKQSHSQTMVIEGIKPVGGIILPVLVFRVFEDAICIGVKLFVKNDFHDSIIGQRKSGFVLGLENLIHPFRMVDKGIPVCLF